MQGTRQHVPGRIAVALLAVAFAASPAHAEDAAPAEVERSAQERADMELCQAVLDAPITLAEAVARVSRKDEQALAAEFARGADGQLLLTVWTQKGTTLDAEFFAYTSEATTSGWDPARRPVGISQGLVKVARWATLSEDRETNLGEVLSRTLKARHHDKREAVAAISAEPSADGFNTRVVVDGLPWGVEHNQGGRVVRMTRPPYLEEREEAARRWVGRQLPELDVEKAEWLHTQETPRLGGLAGRVVLLHVTDPG